MYKFTSPKGGMVWWWLCFVYSATFAVFFAVLVFVPSPPCVFLVVVTPAALDVIIFPVKGVGCWCFIFGFLVHGCRCPAVGRVLQGTALYINFSSANSVQTVVYDLARLFLISAAYFRYFCGSPY